MNHYTVNTIHDNYAIKLSLLTYNYIDIFLSVIIIVVYQWDRELAL